MTFLAIQQPGIARRCGICSRSFLSASHLLDQVDLARAPSSHGDSDANVNEHMEDGFVESGERNMGLLEIMMCALDVCPYCGGKFIG